MQQKHLLLLFFSVFLLRSITISAQRNMNMQLVSNLPFKSKLSSNSLEPFADFNDKISYNLHIGASATFAFGPLVDEAKKIYELSAEGGAKISGKTVPLIFPTVGASVRYQPFLDGSDEYLERLHLSFGLEYFRRGFNSSYTTEYTFSPRAIDDKISYKQQIAIDAVSFPLMLRYGNTFFAELGLCFTSTQRAIKYQNVHHSQSGDEAFTGGFNVTSKESQKIAKSLLVASSSNPRIVVGFQTRGRFGMELGATYFGKTFLSGNNFSNLMTHCKMTFKLNKR